MDVLWPWMLALLILIPLLAGIYLWSLRRRRPAVRYSSLALVRTALPKQASWRRHVPFGLLLAGLGSLVIALGRPVSVVSMPANQTTIILALDVSGSMCQTDIQPSRLAAAKAATESFIQRQGAHTRIGVVAFAGFAETVQVPVKDQRSLKAVVDSLVVGRGTAIGSGILEAIDAIAKTDPRVAPSTRASSPEPAPTPVPDGAYVPAIIVVLTDGVTTQGHPPLDAAQQAKDRGIRVYTIGFGTASENSGFARDCRGMFRGGGFPGGGGFRFRRGIDEDTLRQIADETGGEYYPAESGSDLQEVFDNLPTYLIVETEVHEISAAFVAIGGVLAALAVALSLLWHPLP